MNLVKKSKNLMIYWDEAVYGKIQAKVPTKKANIVQHVRSEYWACLRAIFDDVGQTFLLQNMLDESFKQFKHWSNTLFIKCVRWCWMRLRTLPTCWTNIHVKMTSVFFKFDRFNVRMSMSFWVEYYFECYEIYTFSS